MNEAMEHDSRPVAVRQAEMGATAWREVLRAQQGALRDHSDFYALAGSLADTLTAARSLAGLLARQIETYGEGLAPGRRVYDDTSTVDPHERLVTASVEAEGIAEALDTAEWSAQRFWSAVSYIGVEDAR